MFDVDLKNAGHISGSKMVKFIIDQWSKMDASLRTLKALIASCTELFSGVVESLEEEVSTSGYSVLTPRDIEEIQGTLVESGNQHAEEVDQVEDITAITALQVSTTEVVVPNATPFWPRLGRKPKRMATWPM